MSRIFISYKRVDKDKVFKIKDQIESALDEECWIDLDGIESDAQFVNIIISAIDNADVILFMYSYQHSLIKDPDNDWTIRELSYANTEQKRIVFINLDGSPLTKWFKFMYSQKQQIDARNEESLVHLLVDLRKWLDNTSESDIIDSTSERIQKTFADADSLFANKKYTDALPLFEKCASWGDIESQFKCGWCYEVDNELYSEESAFKWYLKAAQNGHPQAQASVACYYDKGIDNFLSKDYKIAYEWYLKAAQNGNSFANISVGESFEYGKHQYRNNQEAFKWYQKAADLGVSFGYYKLGEFYEYGKGVKSDIHKAIEYYEQSLLRGCGRANDALKRLVKKNNENVGGLEYLPQTHTLIVNEESFHLSSKENDLFALLYKYQNKDVSITTILKTIWVDDNYFNKRSMESYIHQLQKKLVKSRQYKIISIENKAYKLEKTQ